MATLEPNAAALDIEPGESSKFELLIGGDSMLHNCIRGLKVNEGKPQYLVENYEHLNVPAKVEHFVGRKIEMYNLICLIAENRLVTIKGVAGIGKTSLSKSLAHYYLERRAFTHGIIFVSARGLESVDAVINNLYLACNPGNLEDHNKDKLSLIVEMLEHKNVLLIFDNAEDPLSKDKAGILGKLHFLLTRLEKLKILFTSRVAIGPLPDYSEKIYNLYPLDPESAILLLEKRAPRQITENEFAELVDEEPSVVINNPWYTDENGPIRTHKLMQLLSGHPQAISLAAALLNTKTVSELYSQLALSSVQPNEMLSLRSSLELSIECLKNVNEDSIRFFKLMALFPNGATSSEYRMIWGNDYSVHITNLQANSLLVRKMAEDIQQDRYWILPFMADFAFDYLKDYDITLLHAKCCQHHTKKLAQTQAECKNSMKCIPDEANILACLKRGKESHDECTEVKSEYIPNDYEHAKNECNLVEEDKFEGAIPTDEAIQYFPKEESKLSQSIRGKSVYIKSVTINCKLQHDTFIPSNSIISVQKGNQCFKRNSKDISWEMEGKGKIFKGRNSKIEKDILNSSLNKLLVYYETSLVYCRRTEESTNRITSFIKNHKPKNLSVHAHFWKLLGVLSGIANDYQSILHFNQAKRLFTQQGSLLGIAASHLGIGTTKRRQVNYTYLFLEKIRGSNRII